MTAIDYGGTEMTIDFTVLLHVRNDVELTTPYRPHHLSRLMTSSRLSCQALSMQLKRSLIHFLTLCSAPLSKLVILVLPQVHCHYTMPGLKAFISALLFIVLVAGEVRTFKPLIFDIYPLVAARFSVKYCS